MALVSKQTEKIILIGGGVALVAAIFAIRKGAQVVGDNINLINPVDDTNIVNRGVSSIVQTATGGERKDLGGFLFCLFNPKSTACNKNREALNRSLDTSILSDEQVDQLLEQEREFLNNEDGVALGAPGQFGSLATVGTGFDAANPTGNFILVTSHNKPFERISNAPAPDFSIDRPVTSHNQPIANFERISIRAPNPNRKKISSGGGIRY